MSEANGTADPEARMRVLRVCLNQQEWARLHALAIERDQSLADYATALVREHLAEQS